MTGLGQRRQPGYQEVFLGVLHQLTEGHQGLLGRIEEAEQVLVNALGARHRRKLWRYKELLDELYILYQLASFEAGRKAGAESAAESLARVTG
jgi:hypothetical protein